MAKDNTPPADPIAKEAADLIAAVEAERDALKEEIQRLDAGWKQANQASLVAAAEVARLKDELAAREAVEQAAREEAERAAAELAAAAPGVPDGTPRNKVAFAIENLQVAVAAYVGDRSDADIHELNAAVDAVALRFEQTPEL